MSRRISRDQRSPSISTEALSGHPERRLGMGFFGGTGHASIYHLHLTSDMGRLASCNEKSSVREQGMSGVRLLVGTRKGAFVLTSDGKRERWDVSGPHFAGWEIYHVKGSPVDPNRLYCSQSSGWFGQVIQLSNDGGKTWEPVGNKFVYEGDPGTH